MKRFAMLLLCSLLGCGDLGSSSSENVNTSNQIINPDPAKCDVSCFQNSETGEVSISSTCEGGFEPTVPPTVEACTEFIEVGSNSEEEES